jgi:hypothetical protein
MRIECLGVAIFEITSYTDASGEAGLFYCQNHTQVFRKTLVDNIAVPNPAIRLTPRFIF